MANLSTLIQNKKAVARTIVDNFVESNLEEGRIYLYSSGDANGIPCCFCWKSPGTGTAVIEIWGGAGSGSNMCCCGIGLPGNPGAYAKKTISVTANSYVLGFLGCSLGGQTLCFRGCATPTTVTICLGTASTCSCMCAEGGMSGFAICSTTSGSPLTCFNACNFCVTNQSAGCGIVCNIGSTFSWLPSAYGGDVNCGGGFSCLYVGSCDTANWHCFSANVRISAGILSTTQQNVCVPYTCSTGTPFGGAGTDNYYAALSGIGRSPTSGGTYRYCWSSGQYCGCYEAQSCILLLPAAIPGLGPTPCASVRDGGMRGGMGKVKIRYSGT